MSDGFLAAAAALVIYGLYGLSRFARYEGTYFDIRLVLFDNGVYPFLWGNFFLLIGQLLGLRHRRQFMAGAVLSALLLLAWKRATVPAVPYNGQQVFPDGTLLNELIVVCIVMLVLALSDKNFQQAINLVVVKPFRLLLRKRAE